MFNGLFIVIAIIVASGFYTLTYIKIKSVLREKKTVLSRTHETHEIDKVLDESARNMPIFVVIFLFQWIPYAIYAILEFSALSYWEYNLMVVIVTNSGGIWNAFAYRKMLLGRRSDSLQGSKSASGTGSTSSAKKAGIKSGTALNDVQAGAC